MQSGEDLLAVARIDTYNASKTLTHKIKTSAWYTARKTMLHAPRLAGPAVISKSIGLIPMIGAAAGAAAAKASEKIIEKVLHKQMQDKQQNYRDGIDKGLTDREALRKNAKWEAKSVRQVVDKLEANQVKLRDAANKTSQKITSFMAKPTDEAAVVEALMAACEEERYINKLALLSAWAQASFEQIDVYLSDARAANLQAQKFLVDGINQHAAKGMKSNPLYQPPAGPGPRPGAPGTPRPPVPPRR